MYWCYFVFSLILNTAIAPHKSDIPATTSIIIWLLPTIESITPPSSAATICGKQIVQLNRPKYAPIELPESELVSIANGIASIAAQPQPISMNDINSRYWSWIK